ncbi:MAG: hypothetical protein DLM59_18465 [Pseudonocardiales bacterium]|nr:MAG: hypothetical protein DLM59_18465 [Pseudonocardiales bacterium]
MNPRPLALGYLRLQPGDTPEAGDNLIADMHAYAEREGLCLADVFTEGVDVPDERHGRSAFCALLDTLRRVDGHAVIIPSPDHLSRQPYSYRTRSMIIEVEAGARLLVMSTAGTRP